MQLFHTVGRKERSYDSQLKLVESLPSACSVMWTTAACVVMMTSQQLVVKSTVMDRIVTRLACPPQMLTTAF